MHATSSPRRPPTFLVSALATVAFAACQAVAPTAAEPIAAAPTPALATSPPSTATSTQAPTATATWAGPPAHGSITLTDTGCTWAGKPGTISGGTISIDVMNETDDYGLFIVHRLHSGKTWRDGEAAIAVIQEALRTGAEWPPDVSDPITEADADAGLGDRIGFVAPAGTYGVVCSANTSPTGDILTVFLVGPLVVE